MKKLSNAQLKTIIGGFKKAKAKKGKNIIYLG